MVMLWTRNEIYFTESNALCDIFYLFIVRLFQQLQSHLGDAKSGYTSSKDMMLKPREEFPIRVIFAPSRVAAFYAKLQIRQERYLGSSKYAVSVFVLYKSTGICRLS